ncbi:MAG: Gmad2 immunoglobulin-like domain-containing protein [bacterium]
MRRSTTILLLIVTFIAGCTGTGSVTTTSVATTTTEDAPTTSITSTTPAGCPGTPLVNDGEVAKASQPSSDADQIDAITVETVNQCERILVDFVTAEGAPATEPPTFTAEFLSAVGVLRIALDVELTTVTDQQVQSGLIERLYVVRQEDCSLFIDIHLAAAAEARVSVDSSTGQLLVELQPTGGAYDATPTVAVNIVLIAPVPGSVGVPVTLNGYSRNFEANTIGRISQGSTVLAEDFTHAADWVETWGEFTLTLEPTGSGDAELFAGEQSAQDGSDRGVVIQIDLPDGENETADRAIVTFEVAGSEQFKVELITPELVEHARRLLNGENVSSIPLGKVVRNDPGVNAPWSWHIDPATFEFAFATIEVCDGIPSFVEDETITSDSYCPWSAKVISIDPLG